MLRQTIARPSVEVAEFFVSVVRGEDPRSRIYFCSARDIAGEPLVRRLCALFHRKYSTLTDHCGCAPRFEYTPASALGEDDAFLIRDEIERLAEVARPVNPPCDEEYLNNLLALCRGPAKNMIASFLFHQATGWLRKMRRRTEDECAGADSTGHSGKRDLATDNAVGAQQTKGRGKQKLEAVPPAGHARPVVISVPTSECYGEIDVIERDRRALRIFMKKNGPGRRAELCDLLPLERQAYRILEAGLADARTRCIEEKYEQARADGAPIDRSECEPDAETTFEVEWTQDQLAMILHVEDAFSELLQNQKAVIKSAMRRLRNLVRFAQDDVGLVSNADDNGSRRLVIPLRLRKSGQP